MFRTLSEFQKRAALAATAAFATFALAPLFSQLNRLAAQACSFLQASVGLLLAGLRPASILAGWPPTPAHLSDNAALLRDALALLESLRPLLYLLARHAVK